MKKALMILFAAALAVSLCACGSAKPKSTVAPTGAPKPTPPDIQYKEPLTAWPTADLPPELPEFTYGTFKADTSAKMTVKNVPTYELTFSGVTKDDVNAYGATITGNGFTCVPTNVNGTYALACTLVHKDNTSTVVSVALTSDGTCVVMVMLNVQPAG
jgi:hypothetical protein